MSGSIRVRHEGADRFTILVRGHAIVVDQPFGSGGGDAGPTPTELFVAGLASCAAFYAGRFLRRHLQPDETFGVECEFEMSKDGPHRVEAIDLAVTLSRPLPDDIRAGLQRSVEHCTVHSSLVTPPDVRIAIRQPLFVTPGA